VEPLRERGAVDAREVAIPMDPQHGLHEGPMHRQFVHPVREGSGQASQFAHQIRIAAKPVLEAPPSRAGVCGPGAQHEAREIHLPAMGRRIGTVVVAEFALIPEIDHLLHIADGQLLDISVH
jgi:hypothetical protein